MFRQAYRLWPKGGGLRQTVNWFVATLFILLPLAGAATPAQSPIKSATWETTEIMLDQPNPRAVLRIELIRRTRLRVSIVGPDGRTVRTIVPDQTWEQGPHLVSWNGLDDNGRVIPSEAYAVSVEEQVAGNWTPVFEPNAENHGAKSKVQPIQWDPVAGRLLISVAKPSRMRVWALHGDDGMILSTLKDMEPVPGGMLSLVWTGNDCDSNLSLAGWGSVGFHYSGYELPETAILAHGGGQPSYLAVRERYPLQPAAAPRAYENSAPLYRLEYGEQKRLHFSARIDGTTLCITPQSSSLKSFQAGNPSARVFKKNGAWVELSLIPPSRRKGCWTAELPPSMKAGLEALDVIVSTSKEQFGYVLMPLIREDLARS